MSTYYLAKTHQEQILREAAQGRLVRAARRAKKADGKRRPLQTTDWTSRRLHATRA